MSTMNAEPKELFPPSECAAESPRHAWIAKYGLTTRDNGAAGEDEFGTEYGRWSAWMEPIPLHQDMPSIRYQNLTGEGDTEDEALADWARRHGVRMWFEEGYQKPT